MNCIPGEFCSWFLELLLPPLLWSFFGWLLEPYRCPWPLVPLFTEAPFEVVFVLLWPLDTEPISLSEPPLLPLPRLSPNGMASSASKADTESSSDDLGWTGRPRAGGRFAFLGLHLWVSKLDSVLKIRAQNVQTTLLPESRFVFRCVFKCWFKLDSCMNDLEHPVDGHLYGRSPGEENQIQS